MRMAHARMDTTKGISLLIAAWLGAILIANPLGDFPLLDDWAFGRTVAHLLSTGEYDSLGWGWMTLLTNVSWGALFCLPFGFSFTALRVSTLVASAIGLIGVYVLFIEMQRSRRMALLAVALTGFNPYLFPLSLSFMTETLFMALLIWSSIFFIRFVRTGSDLHFFIGIALALASTLSRQLAVCVPMAFAVTYLIKSRFTLPSILRAALPTTICVGAYIAVLSVGLIGGNVNTSVVQSFSDIVKFTEIVLNNTFIVLIHSGLLLLPVLLVETARQWRQKASRVKLITFLAAAIMLFILAVRMNNGDEILLPLSLWLVKSGLGPITQPAPHVMAGLKMEGIEPLSAGFWITVTIMAFAGSVMLITTLTVRIAQLVSHIARKQSMGDVELVQTFSLLTVAIYILLLLPAPMLWDKYVAPIVPSMMLAIVGLRPAQTRVWFDIPHTWRAATWTLVILYGTFAVVGSRDYLAWNRVRWRAIHELIQDHHVPLNEIDAGLEFDGLYLYDPTDRYIREKLRDRRALYLIAFESIPNYATVKEYSYQHWLPWHVQKILVLRRQDSICTSACGP